MNKELEEKSKLIPLIKLVIWVVVFIAVLLIVNYQDNHKSLTSTDDNVRISAQEKSFEEKLKELSNNYSYNYLIKTKDKEYTYVGEKMLDNSMITEHIIKTANNKTNEYFVKNNYVYEVKDGGLEKININTIYENINVDYIDVIKIKELIKNINYSMNGNIYTYDLEDIQIIIVTNNEHITDINIIDKDNNYYLKYNDINNIKNVTY